ncbi:MAG: pyridoxal phosphate-dependent aminotransferase [Spirochaeta sp.]
MLHYLPSEAAMNRYAAAVAHAERFNDFIDLSNTSFSACGWRPPLPAIRRGFENYLNHSGYIADPAGSISARQAIAEYYRRRKISLSPDELILTAGTSEAFSLIVLSATEPGDTVLLPLPGYPLFEDILRMHNRLPRFYPLLYNHDGWYLDPHLLEDSVDTRTRFIMLISPNNPTGWVMSGEEMRAVQEVCRRNSAGLIWDEVFAEYMHSKKPDSNSPYELLSGAEGTEIETFLLGGISKPFLAPELKCGWVAARCSDTVREDMLIKNDLFLSISGPTQHCVPELLQLSPAPAAEAAVHAERMARLLPEIIPSGWRVIPQQGGIHAVVTRETSRSNGNDEDFSILAAETRHVSLQPGYLYGFDDHPAGRNPHWVVSLLVSEKQQQEAWRRLRLIEAKAEY